MDYEESFLDIEQVRMLVKQGHIIWRDHAMKLLRERRITREDVRSAIFNGEIIEDRPDDIPTPSCLILGSSIRGRFLHVICGVLDDMVYIISAYFPDPDKWEADFVTRKG